MCVQLCLLLNDVNCCRWFDIPQRVAYTFQSKQCAFSVLLFLFFYGCNFHRHRRRQVPWRSQIRIDPDFVVERSNTGKGKAFSYSLSSVGPGADPGVQAVNPQEPVVCCHYFPPGLRLPSQLQSITALWSVPSYTAWWQAYRCEQLVQGCYAALPRVGFEPTTC